MSLAHLAELVPPPATPTAAPAEMIDAARARVEGAAATMGSTVVRVTRA
jgi:hypothetical protein